MRSWYFLYQAQAQFGGKGDIGVGQVFASAQEHLFEVGAVAQYGGGAVMGFLADHLDGFALKDELL